MISTDFPGGPREFSPWLLSQVAVGPRARGAAGERLTCGVPFSGTSFFLLFHGETNRERTFLFFSRGNHQENVLFFFFLGGVPLNKAAPAL